MEKVRLIDQIPTYVTRPEDLKPNISEIDSVVQLFEKEFETMDDYANVYNIIIGGEYHRSILDAIEEIYTDAGWKNVKCITSSEKGERPGLTRLHLKR